MARDVRITDRGAEHTTWTERFRPETFADVVANGPVREYLGQRVRRAFALRTGSERHRALILHGPFGCGKTTLVHILANALNCDAPHEDGSPCRACRFCQDFDPYNSTVYEYHHCADDGGRLEDVRAILQTAEGHPGPKRVRVIALDEAHALSSAAQDALLKRLERPTAATLFALLTTRLDKLSATVRSRCDLPAVQSIACDDATAYARALCRHVGVACEDDALALIVHRADGHLRDLVRDLESVAEGGPVTTPRTRRVLGLDHLAHLTGYLERLAQRAAVEAQFAAVDAWLVPAATKAQELQALLLHLYHTEILRLRRPHPLFGTIALDARAAVVADLNERAASGGLDPAAFWEGLVSFWRGPDGGWTEAELGLRLTQFDRYLNGGSAADAAPWAGARGTPKARTGPRTARLPPRADGEHGEGGPWLTRAWARRFWDAGSFLAQEHGVLLNARITFAHGRRGERDHRAAAAHVGDFLHALTTMLDGIACPGAPERSAAAAFHWIYVHEADADGALRTHVVAHLPPWVWPRVRRWFARRVRGEVGTPSGGAATRLRLLTLPRRGRAFGLHVRYLRWLSRGLSPTVTARGETVVDRLRVPPRWQGPIGRLACPQRGRISKTIGDGTQQRWARVGLGMLSAFAWHAWDELGTDWEADEHRERERTKQAFAREEAVALGPVDTQPEPLRATARATVLRALVARRPKEAHHRRRDEVGWWSTLPGPVLRKGRKGHSIDRSQINIEQNQ